MQGGSVARTDLIGDYKEVGQDPKLADRRDDYFAIKILRGKARINWFVTIEKTPWETGNNEPVLLEMSFTVIITEGTKPAYKGLKEWKTDRADGSQW